MGVTLKDVALRAGVSIKTVSNVVHGYEHVTVEMRQRVNKALEELNYQPNLPARYLRKGRVSILALAIPFLTNPYFSDIGKAVITAATARSYTVLIDSTDGERSKETLVINGMYPHLIDGVILSPLALEAEDLLSQRVNVPLVLLGERLFNVPYDHVVIDNVAAARLATQHLISLGRKRIAAIGAQEISAGDTARMRLQGYREALTEAGMSWNPDLVIRSLSYDRIDGIRAMHQLMESDTPPDAVFCFNDLLALGAMRALYEGGYRVPEDVAVIGFDDIKEGTFSMPSLSTIAPNKQEIGDLAVAFLLDRIEETYKGEPRQAQAPFQLIIRESTAGRNA
ncbi:LacI family DNA-binding transcriptional regulator [Dictyobacter formicarum]|uniref:LacI family transcriptional regulator n=1 Tax=Dictyobacter formicarum TaxID=2778368 RepID=A0ABQ3VQX8_9CHLR|nr:LacI family DNA-binding transcriptional regulator [Dictyobacter formicarum]GHO88116.1 LacI family transcriptional regulator [Dictyobacter formicarum]